MGQHRHRVQYTDTAAKALSFLTASERAAVEGRMGLLSSDPYGGTVPDSGMEDRRLFRADGVDVVFWVGREVAILTVVRVTKPDVPAPRMQPDPVLAAGA